jgi:arylsulfatase A-like enzyme
LLTGLVGGVTTGLFEASRIAGQTGGRSGVVEAAIYAVVIDALGFAGVFGVVGALLAVLPRFIRVRPRPESLIAACVAVAIGGSVAIGRLLWLFPARKISATSGSPSDVPLTIATGVIVAIVLFPVLRPVAHGLQRQTAKLGSAAIAMAAVLALALPAQTLFEARSYLGLSRGSAAAVDLGVLESNSGVLLEAGLESALAAPAETDVPPNILLITVDALRADHLGVCGNEWMQTPSIDLLAQYGALSCNTHTQQPQTNPAIASLFTSLYPQEHGVRVHMVDRLPDRFDTLAEILKRRGYATSAILPWTALDPAFSGFHQGFDVYEAYVLNAPETLQNPVTTSMGALYRRVTDQVALGGAVESVLGVRQQVEEDIDGRADVTAAAALQWLNRNSQRAPFFLWTHFFDPHYPFTTPEPWDQLYADPDYSGPYDGSMGFVFQMREGIFEPDEQDVEYLRALYASEVTYTDHYIGQVLGRAAELGLLNNTIVILTADHGESLGEREGPWPDGRYWLHGDDLYNPGTDIPLIVFDPRHPTPGQRLDPPLQLVDIMPTILDLVGLPTPAGLAGRSIVPLLTGGDDGPPRQAFTTLADDRSSSVVTADGWKLITDWDSGARELYYLPTDLMEASNLADSQPLRANQLTAAVDDWFRGNVGLARRGQGG